MKNIKTFEGFFGFGKKEEVKPEPKTIDTGLRYYAKNFGDGDDEYILRDRKNDHPRVSIVIDKLDDGKFIVNFNGKKVKASSIESILKYCDETKKEEERLAEIERKKKLAQFDVQID